MTHIPYHIPIEDEWYSLSFVNYDETAAQDFADRGENAVIEEISLGSETAFGVYTRGQIHTGETVTQLKNTGGPLIDVLLEAYAGVRDEGVAQPQKSVDLESASDAIERVQWKQSVPRVAAELFSNLVMAHPLPNANHRSSLGTAATYISTLDDDFALPTEITEVPVADWVEEFIHESKRLLTVRRKARLFKWLSDNGVDAVERKHGVVIQFADYDLSVSNPRGHFASEHIAVAEEFWRHTVRLYDTSLLSRTDDGRHTCVARLT